MRLVRAELRKLRRPLTLWTAVALVGLCSLLAWGSSSSVASSVQAEQHAIGGPGPDDCAALGMPEGPECERQLAEMREQQAQWAEAVRRGGREAKALHHPVGIGRLAAGLVATFPGAVAMLLLAAGHVGNEWSARTIRSVLTQEGRRWRVLAAKLVSLWLAGVGLLLAVWAVLAALSPLLAANHDLPGPAPTLAQAWGPASAQAARALLVLAAFAVVGTLAAVVTRNALGAFFLAFAFLVGSLILFNFASLTKGTVTYWVLGWMGLRDQEFSIVTWSLWPTSLPQVRVGTVEGQPVFEPLPFPSHLAGLYGLAGLVLVGGALAILRMQRADVQV